MSCIGHIFCPVLFAEGAAEGTSPLAGSDHPTDHPVHASGHPGGVFPHHDGPKETSVRRHLQPQLPGGGRCQAGDG